eukprot:m.108081 g.108081  ORF g.108081 m.108081 type:complete len:86 (+) comp37306_c1_seq18:1513-1770(+)
MHREEYQSQQGSNLTFPTCLLLRITEAIASEQVNKISGGNVEEDVFHVEKESEPESALQRAILNKQKSRRPLTKSAREHLFEAGD